MKNLIGWGAEDLNSELCASSQSHKKYFVQIILWQWIRIRFTNAQKLIFVKILLTILDESPFLSSLSAQKWLPHHQYECTPSAPFFPSSILSLQKQAFSSRSLRGLLTKKRTIWTILKWRLQVFNVFFVFLKPSFYWKFPCKSRCIHCYEGIPLPHWMSCQYAS